MLFIEKSTPHSLSLPLGFSECGKGSPSPQNEVEIKPIPSQYQAAGQGGGHRLLLGIAGNDTPGLLATGGGFLFSS